MRGHNGVMIDVDLARRLRDAGLRWHPRPGDRFTIEQGDFDSAEVFTISDMTVEAHDYPTGTVLGFNGTTEWALDSVAATDALWLPREDQLRDLLGRSFESLVRRHASGPGGAGDDETVAYEVRTRAPGSPAGSDLTSHLAGAADDAYALALLSFVEASLRLD